MDALEESGQMWVRQDIAKLCRFRLGDTTGQMKISRQRIGGQLTLLIPDLEKDPVHLEGKANQYDIEHLVRHLRLVYQPLQEPCDGLLRGWNSVQADTSDKPRCNAQAG